MQPGKILYIQTTLHILGSLFNAWLLAEQKTDIEEQAVYS